MSIEELQTAHEQERADKQAIERRDAITGLRTLADFLEAHPGVPFPFYNTLNAHVAEREDIARIARLSAWEKSYGEGYFSLRKRFGGNLVLDVYTEREKVCRRVVVGKRVLPAQPEREIDEVEWVCEEALLAPEAV